MEYIIGLFVGLVLATVIWYFVLRNNKAKINLWLKAPEEYFTSIQSEIGNLSLESRQKIQDIINEIKRKRK